MYGRAVPQLHVDLNDLSLWTEGPPFDTFARMREAGAIHWSEPTATEPGYWSVVTHDDIVAVNKDWERFSSARRGITIVDGGILPKDFQNLVFSMIDPPEHRRQRDILQKVFTSRAVAAREEDIRATANRLIDDVIEAGTCDLVADIAVDFPLTVTANMLGVPHEDRGKLFDWTNIMADTRSGLQAKQQMLAEMGAYVLTLVTDRREHPQDDLLSRLIAADVDGEKLDDLELVAHFAQLMAGGNETTRNAFAGGMLALMEHPDQRQRLIDDPGLIPGAVEEVLRWHTPVLHMARTATCATTIAGQQVAEDDLVVLWHVSGNRDAAAIIDPDRFDVTRGRVSHTSFGGGGIHFCLGNQLARLELRILLEQTLQRMPDTELTGRVEREASNTFHWMRAIPVAFTATARTAVA
jgi:cytochrome P450